MLFLLSVICSSVQLDDDDDDHHQCWYIKGLEIKRNLSPDGKRSNVFL